MFAVSSVDAAKAYYQTFKQLQSAVKNPLKIATIFSFAANEDQQDAVGDIADESLEADAMNSTAKEFLKSAIDDYNGYFKTNYNVDGKSFQNYYRDLAKRVKNKEVDLLIVVGMFLTGFDAPTLNTLFVDKNLRYHGLIQAYSRTNRIYNSTKTFGNIVTFRDLEQDIIDAITLFGKSDMCNVVLEKSYQEYMEGFTDASVARRGYLDVIAELKERFPNPDEIQTEKDKKAFVKLFGEYLQVENILQNYDEFAALQAFQSLDISDVKAVEAFKENYYLTDDAFAKMQPIDMPSERSIQNYRSTYNDIRDWLCRQKEGDEKAKLTIDWDDVVFEVDLLKSQEINLDYILELIFEHNKKIKNKSELIDEIQTTTRASLGNRAKETLIVDFINQTDLDNIADKAGIIESFFQFAQKEQQKEANELISSEGLNIEAAKRYINASLKRGYASEQGTDLNDALPKMSPLNPQYYDKKGRVFQKIDAFVKKFKEIDFIK